jgi:demethylmenaquinone methyltransferase/2-methoxy-6-polyprenyl-1,4-benzoquinol methylase
VVLEFGRPRLAPVAWVNDFYCRVVMPRTATLISGDTSGAYKYLPRSIDTFLTSDAMLRAIQEAGFEQVTMRPLTMGVCACFRGVAPA